MSTGHCREDDQENPWYVPLTCGNYSADEDAEWYLNMNEKETLTQTGEVTKADVQAFSGGRNCPVMGLFRAGTIQREEITQREESEGESEIYVPELAYDKTIYEGYPPGAKNPIVKAYGLVTVKPNPPSDICSGGRENQADYYDRRVPCKAHDYCYDLIRFAVAPSLSESDCDDKFHDLMNSDCADRGNLKSKCISGINIPSVTSNPSLWNLGVQLIGIINSPLIWAQGVRLVGIDEDEVRPGVVMIKNVKTGMCVDVEEGSDEDGARLIQWPCEEDSGQISKNRQFRFNIKRDLDGDSYFHIKPEHQPGYCVSVTDTNNVVMRISCRVITNPASFGYNLRAPSSSLFVLVEDNENNEERYTIRNSDSPNRCWSPATLAQGSRLINSSPCNRDSALLLWEIREVEE